MPPNPIPHVLHHRETPNNFTGISSLPPAMPSIYEIESKEIGQEYIVDLIAHYCNSRNWEAPTTILGCQEDPQPYSESLIHLQEYNVIYGGPIFHPLMDTFNQSLPTLYDMFPETDSACTDSEEDILELSDIRLLIEWPKKRRIRHVFGDEILTHEFKCSCYRA